MRAHTPPASRRQIKPGRYARLSPDWMLRGWSDVPAALVNWRTGVQRELPPAAFYVAKSCDGRANFDSMAFLPEHLGMLQWLIDQGIAQQCAFGQSIEPWQKFRKAKNPRINGLLWCITGRCNLQCRHCYMEAPGARYGHLPAADMIKLLDEFQKANVIELSLSGGEPFVRDDILDIIRGMAQRKICLSHILTNGLLITDRHLDAIHEAGFHPQFQISVDGVGAHDEFRGMAGSEQGAVAAIRRLRAKGFPVMVATTMHLLNLDRLEATYELMKTLDIEVWRVEAPHINGNWRGVTTAASLDQQADALAPLAKRWKKDGMPFAIQLGYFYHGPPPMQSQNTGRIGQRPRDHAARRPIKMPVLKGYCAEDFDCAGCRERANLLPDGTLLPCPRYVDTPVKERMPNVLRDGLAKAWKRSFFRRVADLKKKQILPANPECAGCEFFKMCGMGCRGSALNLTGNILSKDPLTCDVFKKGYHKRFQKLTGGIGPRFA